MTGHDAFAANLDSWLDDEARAPIPADALDHALATIASRRPRPARLAHFGSHWIDGPSSAAALRGGWRISVPLPRSASAVLLLLLMLALIGAALLVGGTLIERHPGLGRLAYELDGDIYLADVDGRNPTRIADGAPAGDASGTGSFSLVGWAPDGRHLLYEKFGGAPWNETAYIGDPNGRVIASFSPSDGNVWSGLGWSPDSTRLVGWTAGSTAIGVFGLDGRRQSLISIPAGDGRFREYPGLWAHDGRSVVVRLHGLNPDIGGYWDLPIDGSAPHRLADTDPRASLYRSFTSDGTRVAISQVSLTVANADGTNPRVLERGRDVANDCCSGDPGQPMWSPDETHLAYDWVRSQQAGNAITYDSDLRIADVASGIVRTLIAHLPVGITVIGWSPAGDRILFSTFDDKGAGSLWTVNPDGSGRTLLVEGATQGSWQPDQRKPVETPSPTPTATASATPSFPSFGPDVVPVVGPLQPGTYTDLDVDSWGFNLRFTVPAGWTWNGRYLSKGGVGRPGGAAIYFFGGPVQVYTDPCHWAGAQPNPPTSNAVDALMAALAAQRSRNATTPTARPLSDHAGMAVQLTVPDNLDLAQCDGGQFRSWGPESNVRSNQGPGQRDLVWAVSLVSSDPSVGGLRAIIDGASFPGTPPDVMSEIDAILSSIVVGQWG